MKTLNNSGLLELARKYTAKTLNIKSNSVQVVSTRKTIKVSCNLQTTVSKQRLNSLLRVLKSKGLVTPSITTQTQQTPNGRSQTTLKFELKLAKRTRKPKKKQIHASVGDNQMNREHILANSLAQGMRYQFALSSLNKQLKKDLFPGNKVEADAGGGLGLKVMRHGDGARLVQTVYQDYVSDKDYTGFLDFFKEVDDLLYKFRGNKELDLNSLQDEDEDDSPRRGKGKRGGRKSFAPKGGAPARKQAADTETTTDPSDQSVVISKDSLSDNDSRDRIKSMLNKYYGK